MNEISEELKKDYYKLSADIYLVQANQQITGKRSIDALKSYLKSGEYYINCKNERNLKIVIDNLVKYAIPNIEIKHLKEDEDIELKFNAFILLLNEKLNENGVYDLEIRELKNKFKQISSNQNSNTKNA